MKDSTDIKSESEIEVKEEVENGQIDSESQITKILKTKTYCLLCQEYGHVINDNCVVNATCFSCGVKGHVRRDCYCLICQEPGHVLNDGCVTCLGCGVRGHARRDCPSLLDENLQIHDTGQKQPLSLQSQEHNPEVEILNDQNMECPPSLDTVNIIPKNDNTPATEYERGRQRDIDRRMYNLKTDAPCKFFLNKGCRFGISCRFKHDIERRKTEVESRSSRGRSRSRSPTDSSSEKTLVGAEAGPSDATTVECQGQGSSGRNQGGHHQPVPAYNAETSDPPRKGGKDYSPEERQAIVREVLVDLVAPTVLARKYKISTHSIRDWVKKTGQKLPTEYKQPGWGPRSPKFPLSIQPKNGDRGTETDRERIYNHPGLPSEIEACRGGNTAHAVKTSAKAGLSEATTVECQGQIGSGNNQVGPHQPVVRQAIVREVVFDLIPPSDLARKYKISAHSIRNWVKKAGHSLPTFYKTNITNLLSHTKFPPSQDTVNIPPNNGHTGMERDRDRRIHNQPGLPSEIVACVGANMAVTDANAEKALVGVKVVPVDATTMKCNEEGGSGRNQGGHSINQTNNGPNKRDPQECHVCNKILYSFRTLNNHMRFEHGIFSETSSRINSW